MDVSRKAAPDPDPGQSPPSPLTVAAFQAHIRDRYGPTDSARGIPGTFLWFTEGSASSPTPSPNASGGSSTGPISRKSSRIASRGS